MSEQDNQDVENIEFPDSVDAEALDGEAVDAQGAEAEVAEPLSELEQLQAERDDFESRLLRVSADYQNFARRAQQNIEAAAEQKAMDIARGLVTVLDHFDHALGVDVENTSTEDVMKGVTMVKDELLSALSRFGIERVEVQVGDEFDPVKHEALMRQPSEEVEADHVTMQMQPGYVIGEKIIRPAQVGVAQ